MSENVRQGSNEIGFTTFPEMLQTITPDESLKKICTEAGIPFFSATEAFLLQCENQPLYYTYDGHFTPQGHEFFAHQLQLLFQKQFLDNKDN